MTNYYISLLTKPYMEWTLLDGLALSLPVLIVCIFFMAVDLKKIKRFFVYCWRGLVVSVAFILTILRAGRKK